jgi:hypothetical protein
MHILIGLVVATVLAIGWACGNLFACVFLSLPVGLLAIIYGATSVDGSRTGPVVLCLSILVAIWLPRTFIRYVAARELRRNQLIKRGIYRLHPRPAEPPYVGAGQRVITGRAKEIGPD